MFTGFLQQASALFPSLTFEYFFAMVWINKEKFKFYIEKQQTRAYFQSLYLSRKSTVFIVVAVDLKGGGLIAVQIYCVQVYQEGT
jgi:hypothetical protein